jgi:hypothetical protein
MVKDRETERRRERRAGGEERKNRIQSSVYAMT